MQNEIHPVLQQGNSLPHARFRLLTWEAPVLVLLTEQRNTETQKENADPWSLGIYVEIKEERFVCVCGGGYLGQIND